MRNIGARGAGWIGFALLLVACAGAWWWTAAAVSTSGFPVNGQSHTRLPDDERPLVIASAMSGLADTPEEQQLAQQAQQAAEQLVQQALRRDLVAAKQAPSQERGPEWTRFDSARAAVAKEKAAAQALQKQMAAAKPAELPALQAESELTQAQMQLDQARLDDARQDLRRSRAPAMMTPEQVLASTASAEAAARQLAAKWQQRWRKQSTARNPGTAQGLSVLITSWRLLAAKVKALSWAQGQSAAAAAAARRAHVLLHVQLQRAEAQNSQRMAGELASLRGSGAKAAANQGTEQGTEALVNAAEQLAAGQRRLIGYDHTAQVQSSLAQIYQRWVAIGVAQQELAIHDAFGLWLEILAGFALLLILDWLAERAARRWRGERRRVHTVRHLVRFVLVVAGLAWLLLITLGKPAQWLTFLGLAGAGLTVALEDTILSFAGWFVVIGRHGVTPGDWVEINGVNGEVVEVTLLQTALLEAGNWNEPGHATGRRVYVPNSFVFTGPYFNFSTGGQWLWDEIRLAPLAGQAWTPEAMAEIAALVEAETRADAAAAEHEWSQLRHSRRHAGGPAMAGVVAAKLEFAPVVQLKPGVGGGDLCVRYITTAALRAQRREHLYRRIFAARAAAAAR